MPWIIFTLLLVTIVGYLMQPELRREFFGMMTMSEGVSQLLDTYNCLVMRQQEILKNCCFGVPNADGTAQQLKEDLTMYQKNWTENCRISSGGRGNSLLTAFLKRQKLPLLHCSKAQLMEKWSNSQTMCKGKLSWRKTLLPHEALIQIPKPLLGSKNTLWEKDEEGRGGWAFLFLNCSVVLM